MLKLRLKRVGRKKLPFYRLVVMENSMKRNGIPIDEVGYYNPITKDFNFNRKKILKWLAIGVTPTSTVLSLLKGSNILEPSNKLN